MHTHTHTHTTASLPTHTIDRHLSMIATPLFHTEAVWWGQARCVSVCVSRSVCPCEETAERKVCDSIFSHTKSPLGSGQTHGRSEPHIIVTVPIQSKNRGNCLFRRLSSLCSELSLKPEAPSGWGKVSVCDLLLEGGERLEEFRQIDLRVATVGQDFVGDFLQPAVHFLLSVPSGHMICRGKKRKSNKPHVASTTSHLLMFDNRLFTRYG